MIPRLPLLPLLSLLAAARGALAAAAVGALAVLLPTECVGCGARDHPLCPRCSEAIGPPASAGGRTGKFVIEVPGSRPLPVWASVPYGGTVRTALSAFKESGRTDAAASLARVLEPAVADARRALCGSLPPGAALELTVAPSSRVASRRRGYRPVSLLAGRARGDLRLSETLRVARPTADQAGLGVEQRRANLRGSLRVRRKLTGALDGRHFLLVDDVVTTGSTLVECQRALESAGATVWGAATLAHTPKHHGVSSVRRVDERAGHLE